MSPEMQEQARRWKAHPSFRWMIGMDAVCVAPPALLSEGASPARFIGQRGRVASIRDGWVYIGIDYFRADSPRYLPNLEDPATQGLLLFCLSNGEPMGPGAVSGILDALEAS